MITHAELAGDATEQWSSTYHFLDDGKDNVRDGCTWALDNMDGLQVKGMIVHNQGNLFGEYSIEMLVQVQALMTTTSLQNTTVSSSKSLYHHNTPPQLPLHSAVPGNSPIPHSRSVAPSRFAS